MPEYKFTATTPASVLLAEFQKVNACAESMTFHNAAKSLNSAYSVLDMANGITEESWAIWHLKRFGADTDPEIRKVLLGKIKHPPFAFYLYITVDCWTDDEDKILEGIFEGQVPQMEKDLAEGKVTRAKQV